MAALVLEPITGPLVFFGTSSSYRSYSHFVKITYISTNSCDIYEEMSPNNFGRIMAYLVFVYKVRDSNEKETLRKAVRKTVEDLKHIDLEKYKVSGLFNSKRC